MLRARVALALGGPARRARQPQPQEPNGSRGSRRRHRPGPPRARATHRRVPRVSPKRDLKLITLLLRQALVLTVHLKSILITLVLSIATQF